MIRQHVGNVVSGVIALLALNGLCAGQVFYAGTESVSLGGAVIQPPVERRLPVRNIGSSGNDGVELHLGRSVGWSGSVDVSCLVSTPGAMLRCESRDVSSDPTATWPSVMLLSGGGGGGGAGGSMVCVFDYTCFAATGVQWVVRDGAGKPLASGVSSGSVLDCSLFTGWSGDCASTSAHRIWLGMSDFPSSVTGRSKGHYVCGETDHFRVQMPGLAPINNAASIEAFPIICITSPCPGDWTGMSSVRMTARGISGFDVTDFSRQVVVRPVNDPPTLVDRATCDISCSNGLIASSLCPLPPPPDCPVWETSLRISKTMAVDDWEEQDRIMIDPPLNSRIDSSGIVHRDLAARSMAVECDFIRSPSAPGGANPGVVLEVTGRKWGNGHVTLMKFTEEEDPSGARLITVDPRGHCPSGECLVQLMSSSGTVLASEVVSHVATVSNAAGSRGQVTARAQGNRGAVIQFDVVGAFASSGITCTLPSGVGVSGVHRIVWSPVSPSPVSSISRKIVQGKHFASVVLHRVSASPMLTVSGDTMLPLGSASIATCCDSDSDGDGLGDGVFTGLSNADTDGVEVMNGGPQGGSVTVGLQDILAATGGEIKIKHKGWDGLIYHRSSMRSLNFSKIEYSYKPQDESTGRRWVACDRNGMELASGTFAVSFTAEMDLEPDPGSPPAAMRHKGSGYDLKKMKKCFTSEFEGGTMRIVVPGQLPVSGVARIDFSCDLPITLSVASQGYTATEVTSNAGQLHLYRSASSSWSWGNSNPGSAGGVAFARTIGGCIKNPLQTRPPAGPQALMFGNIGSSGQDGVEIEFLDASRTGYTTRRRVEVLKSNRQGDPNQRLSLSRDEYVRNYGFRVECVASSASEGSPAVFSLQERSVGEVFTAVRCDVSGRGSSACLVTLRSSSGAVCASEVVDQTQAVRLYGPGQAHWGNAKFGVADSGDPQVQFPVSVRVQLPSGSVCDNTASIDYAPVSPTLPAASVGNIRLTGTSAGTWEVVSVETSAPTCLADLGKQGGVPGADGLFNNNDFIVFIDLFFAGSSAADLGQQGGIPGSDGLLNNNDFIVFIDLFFAGCST